MRTYTLNNGVKIPVIGLGASIIPKTKDSYMDSPDAKRQYDLYQYAFGSYPPWYYL